MILTLIFPCSLNMPVSAWTSPMKPSCEIQNDRLSNGPPPRVLLRISRRGRPSLSVSAEAASEYAFICLSGADSLLPSQPTVLRAVWVFFCRWLDGGFGLSYFSSLPPFCKKIISSSLAGLSVRELLGGGERAKGARFWNQGTMLQNTTGRTV